MSSKRARTNPRSGDLSVRDHILAKAGDLFFREGYRAIGVDTIVAESGVAKMTLYRYFPSKDDLIVAFLEESNAKFIAWLDGTIAPYAGQPRKQLIALFEALVELCKSPSCFGCAFSNASAEFPELDHPGHRVAAAHKQAARERLRAMAKDAGARDPDVLASQLMLVMDGAFVAVRMFGPGAQHSPAYEAASAAKVLVEAQMPAPVLATGRHPQPKSRSSESLDRN